MTVDEFDAFVMLPENRNRLYEFIGGEIVEVVSNGKSSSIGMLIGARITVFVELYGLGYVTGANGGYKVWGERYIPKAAFVSQQKQSKPSREAYNPVAPDLVVEIMFPANVDNFRIKIANYLAAGTVVWVVEHEKKQVEIYAPGKPPAIVGMNAVLDGGECCPVSCLRCERYSLMPG